MRSEEVHVGVWIVGLASAYPVFSVPVGRSASVWPCSIGNEDGTGKRACFTLLSLQRLLLPAPLEPLIRSAGAEQRWLRSGPSDWKIGGRKSGGEGLATKAGHHCEVLAHSGPKRDVEERLDVQRRLRERAKRLAEPAPAPHPDGR